MKYLIIFLCVLLCACSSTQNEQKQKAIIIYTKLAKEYAKAGRCDLAKDKIRRLASLGIQAPHFDFMKKYC